MKPLFGIIILVGFLSCIDTGAKFETIEAKDLTTAQIDSILNLTKIQYDTPIVMDSAEHVLIPISSQLFDRRKSYSKSIYSPQGNSRYWNLLFYSRKSGESHLLTKDKIRISNIFAFRETHEYGATSKFIPGKILYLIRDIDFDKNKKLDYNDPEALFISDPNGNNLTRVSPADEHLYFFEVLSSPTEILIKTLRDVNTDLAFDENDESIWYIAKFDGESWQLQEIMDASERKVMERLYFDHWLKKK